MFNNVQANFWYNLEHHTIPRSGYMAGESDFGRFLQNEAWDDAEYSTVDVKFVLMRPLRGVENFF